MTRTKVPSGLAPDMAAFLDDLARRLDEAETTITTQGTSIDTLTGDVTELQTAPVDPFTERLFHIQEQTASGVDGIAMTANVWTTRIASTVLTNEITGASVDSAGNITLPAGTYFADIFATSFNLSTHRTWLYNQSAGAVVPNMYSTSERGGLAGASGVSHSVLRGRFTLTAQTILSIQTNPASGADTYDASAITAVVEIGVDACFFQKAA